MLLQRGSLSHSNNVIDIKYCSNACIIHLTSHTAISTNTFNIHHKSDKNKKLIGFTGSKSRY